jgi:hypothetical protein
VSPRRFSGLKPGDLIRHKQSGSALIVHQQFGVSLIAVRITTASNPEEWDRVHPNGAVKTDDEA